MLLRLIHLLTYLPWLQDYVCFKTEVEKFMDATRKRK